MTNFFEDKADQLSAPLRAEHIGHKKGYRGGREIQIAYIEGWAAIENANTIFGFGNWDLKVDEVRLIPEARGCQAMVTVTVGTPDFEWQAQRQDIGFCSVPLKRDAVFDPTNIPPDDYDTAYKGAVTDAMKRALRTFGDQFGNGLYRGDAPPAERTYERDGEGGTRPAPPPPRQQRQSRPSGGGGDIRRGVCPDHAHLKDRNGHPVQWFQTENMASKNMPPAHPVPGETDPKTGKDKWCSKADWEKAYNEGFQAVKALGVDGKQALVFVGGVVGRTVTLQDTQMLTSAEWRLVIETADSIAPDSIAASEEE